MYAFIYVCLSLFARVCVWLRMYGLFMCERPEAEVYKASHSRALCDCERDKVFSFSFSLFLLPFYFVSG